MTALFKSVPRFQITIKDLRGKRFATPGVYRKITMHENPDNLEASPKDVDEVYDIISHALEEDKRLRE